VKRVDVNVLCAPLMAETVVFLTREWQLRQVNLFVAIVADGNGKA
jgi:hypothetical protein